MAKTTWIAPGERRRQITIQQEPTATKTALGFLASGGGTWTDVVTTWAKIDQYVSKKGAATVGASNEPMIAMYYEVNIRYVPGVSILPGMRVVEQSSTVSGSGATYRIQAVVDVEQRHRELHLSCTQIPATAAETQ